MTALCDCRASLVESKPMVLPTVRLQRLMSMETYLIQAQMMRMRLRMMAAARMKLLLMPCLRLLPSVMTTMMTTVWTLKMQKWTM